MLRRFRCLLLVSVLAIMFAAPALAPPARASLGVPAWSVGDYWTYELTGDASPTPGSSSKVRYDVLGTESVTVSGNSYTSYHVKLTFTASSGSSSFTLTVTYNPPVEVRWPLTASAQWSASSVVTTVIEFTGQPPSTTTAALAESLRVKPDESKTVPAGTFTATPLVETETGGGSYVKGYWSGVVGNVVEQKSYDSNDAEIGGMELTSYRHAPPGAGNILGLPIVAWALILLVIIIAVIAAVMMRRRRPVVPAGFPPTGPPTTPQAPMAPPPQAPPMPPQGPGGPYPPP